MRRHLLLALATCLLCGGLALLFPSAPQAQQPEGAAAGAQAGKTGKAGKAGKAGKLGKLSKVSKTGKAGKTGKTGKAGKAGPRRLGKADGLKLRPPAAATDDDAAIAALVRRGSLRAAMPQVRERLEQDPDNVDMHAALAILCAGAGELSCALTSSRFAVGSELFPREFALAEAAALRADGQGAAAAARRKELLWVVDNAPEEARQLALAARDQREVGALDAAARDLDLAEATDPGSALVHLERVLSALQQGDLDEADWELWLRRRSGAPWTGEDIEAELRFGLAADDLIRLQSARTPRARDLFGGVSLSATRARALIRTDGLTTALTLVGRSNHRMWGEVLHTELSLATAAVYAAAGATDEADDILRRTALLAPRHPDWRTWGQRPPR
jgi:tetratricopeptide (TPR) repeat protein